jgi:hypothetical protein
VTSVWSLRRLLGRLARLKREQLNGTHGADNGTTYSPIAAVL